MDALSSRGEELSSPVSLLDTTLRDGEQTPYVSFRPEEKLKIAKDLLALGVDRVEVCSAGASSEDEKAFEQILDHARSLDREVNVEALTFLDRGNVEWLKDRDGRISNILVKGSLNHVQEQIGKTGEGYIKDVLETIDLSLEEGLRVNVYLEDWGSGVKENSSYTQELLQRLNGVDVDRVMVCDTLGILSPALVKKFVSRTGEIFGGNLDFHAHNDYGLATANSGQAFSSGCGGLHATANGLGERTGNAPLSEVVMYLEDHLDVDTGVDLKSLGDLSKRVELYSGISVHSQKPLVGRYAFVHTGGIHHDGEVKGGLYTDRLSPERFGREGKIAAGKLSGRSTVEYVEDKFGENLDSKEVQKILEEVKWLGERKVKLEPEDLKYIIERVRSEERIRLRYIEIEKDGSSSRARAKIEYNGDVYEGQSSGDGGFDAFMNVLEGWSEKMGFKLPKLRDYEVEIPPAGGTDALVKCKIEWEDADHHYSFGTSKDQDRAAVKAAMGTVNILLGQ